jgi:GDPmannose 4,6-dehydratase
MAKALILGISGQDGSYLTEHLLKNGYEVYGVIRRNSVPEHQESRISGLPVKTYYGDLLDQSSLNHVLKEVRPDEIYNLAAQSHVRISFDIPQFTVQTNAMGVLNLLESVRHFCPEAKVYQASSSEMFGNSVDPDGFQRETTPMHQVSPYGCAKLFAYNITKVYRQSYGLKIYNGILFNHESPRRGSNFVTNKVIKAAVRIKLKLQDDLDLGNIHSFRDWGHSKDYVRAMHLIMQQEPGDWVVSTMQTYSVADMLKYVGDKLGIEIPVKICDQYKRPYELEYLRGDSSRIRELGWQPEYTFQMLMDEMINFWLKHYGQ